VKARVINIHPITSFWVFKNAIFNNEFVPFIRFVVDIYNFEVVCFIF
jgi:hypothetical protein